MQYSRLERGDSNIGITYESGLNDNNNSNTQPKKKTVKRKTLSFYQVIKEYPLPNPRNVVMDGIVKINVNRKYNHNFSASVSFGDRYNCDQNARLNRNRMRNGSGTYNRIVNLNEINKKWDIKHVVLKRDGFMYCYQTDKTDFDDSCGYAYGYHTAVFDFKWTHWLNRIDVKNGVSLDFGQMAESAPINVQNTQLQGKNNEIVDIYIPESKEINETRYIFGVGKYLFETKTRKEMENWIVSVKSLFSLNHNNLQVLCTRSHTPSTRLSSI